MRCCVYTVIRVEELEGLVHAELAQIWEFVAIFPRHAVGPVQQSDAAAPTARIALETSSCASARSLR